MKKKVVNISAWVGHHNTKTLSCMATPLRGVWTQYSCSDPMDVLGWAGEIYNYCPHKIVENKIIMLLLPPIF